MFYALAERLGTSPEWSTLVLLFFSYSLLGYILECIWLTIEKRRFVYKRGFVRHLPFCIIYGFGAMIGYTLLSPVMHNLLLLFLFGAVAATMFEFMTAKLQIRLFGDFWWDYTEKPFNYKGILCLESTIGWGVAALVIIRVLHPQITGFVAKVPPVAAFYLAAVLMVAYGLDFVFSARRAMRKKREQALPDSLPEEIAEEMTV